MSEGSLEVTNKTKSKTPRLPFLRMKEAVLGKKYELGVVFIGSTRSRTLNHTYRGKDKPANILSFPLSEMEGEIFIDLAEARRQSSKYGRTYTNFIGFLFIHGLFHLKGFDHSGTMERAEEKIRKRFNI